MNDLVMARLRLLLAKRKGQKDEALTAGEESDEDEDEDEEVVQIPVKAKSKRPRTPSKSTTTSRNSPQTKDPTAEDGALAARLQAELNGHNLRRPKRAKTKRTRKTVKSEGGEGDGVVKKRETALTKPVKMSQELSEFLGNSSGMLPRTQIVKEVWVYIKQHELQNPQDRREVLCDERMEKVFGPKTTIFGLNKVISKHVYRPDE